MTTRGWKYLEVRPIGESFQRKGDISAFRPAKRYRLHRIDLRPDLEQVRSGFDKDSVVRRVRRAERAGLIEKVGHSESMLSDFYSLLILTRARHRLPPQPYEWFQNLIECMGDALEIRLAYKQDTPIASVLTLRFRESVVYKYGCSDAAYKHLGAMPLLLWRAIEKAKSTGAQEFSLGRSEQDDSGLIGFKDHWTNDSTPIVYWRYPGPVTSELGEGWRVSMMKRVFAHMPKGMLAMMGRLIYRHIG